MILYLGLELPAHLSQRDVIHYPIIQIVPRDKQSRDIQTAFAEFDRYTHVIFTSKSAVDIFYEYASYYGIDFEKLEKTCFVAVGQMTALRIRQHNPVHVLVSMIETAEGIIETLSHQDLQNAHLFWPHSKRSRATIPEWLNKNKIRYREVVFYDTLNHFPIPSPDLNQIQEIIFTSSSTIDAFLQKFGSIPRDKKLTCIGPITQKHLEKIHLC